MTGVSVGANQTLNTHDFSLSDGENTYGFTLQNGVESFIERAQTPSTILARGGAQKWGDYDPLNAQVEQRTFVGGRGSKDFSQDQTQFWDSQNAFTMLDGRVCPAPQWKIATGCITQHKNLPGDVAWQPLTGSNLYAASSFTIGASNLGGDNVQLWIRRIGSPGTLTVEIWSDSSGPDAVVTDATASVTTTTIDDYISRFHTFDLSAASDLTAATAYWVVIYGASTDNKTNHWEVGVDDTTTSSQVSSDGSSWSTATFSLYYRVVPNIIERSFFFFEMYGALFAVAKKLDGTSCYMYMNGEIGVAVGQWKTKNIKISDIHPAYRPLDKQISAR